MKRPLPPSQVIASTVKDGKLPKRQGDAKDARPHGCADEYNAQRQRPTWDEKRP